MSKTYFDKVKRQENEIDLADNLTAPEKTPKKLQRIDFEHDEY